MNEMQRDRMTEAYVAVHDVLQRTFVATYQPVDGRLPRLAPPSYLPAAPAQTVAEYQAALAKLGALGIVKRVS